MTTAPRVIIISKRTQYWRFVEDHPTPRVQALLAQGDPSVARWEKAHRDHHSALERVEAEFRRLGARTWVLYGPHVRFDTSDAALVVTVGGDGTLLAASHHVSDVPIIGVNSSPETSVGFFCAVHPDNLESMLGRALAGELSSVRLARMSVTLNGHNRSNRVLNEALFCHAIPAATSQYLVRLNGQTEEQRSSGLWIGTAAGSTGAILSAGGKVLPFASKKLQLVTREPCASFGKRQRRVRVVVQGGDELTVISKMDTASLFLDGPFQQLRISLGDQLGFTTSNEPLTVLGLHPRRDGAQIKDLPWSRRRR